jgi:hypothetical protein
VLPVNATLLVDRAIIVPNAVAFTTIAPVPSGRIVMVTAGTTVDLLGHRDIADSGENSCRVAERESAGVV